MGVSIFESLEIQPLKTWFLPLTTVPYFYLQPQHNGGKQLNSTSNETTNVCGNNGPSPQPPQQQQQSSIHIKN